MDLLIFFSASKAAELRLLTERLGQDEIESQSMALPNQWELTKSDKLLEAIQSHSHWAFLIDDREADNPCFVFAVGLCLTKREHSYLLCDSPSLVPVGWQSHITVVLDRDALASALIVERHRWQAHLAREAAREKLIERGIEVTNSCFWEAVEKGDLGSCELFLEAGFSPDLTNKKGVSVLCMAVRSAHLGVLRVLLDAGADVNLRSKDRDNSPLMDASAEGLTDIVRELIRRKADLTGVSRNGQNALVLAIGKGAQDVAGLLLEAGGDPFVPDKLGMNACQYAQLLGRKEFLEQVKQLFPSKL